MTGLALAVAYGFVVALIWQFTSPQIPMHSVFILAALGYGMGWWHRSRE